MVQSKKSLITNNLYLCKIFRTIFMLPSPKNERKKRKWEKQYWDFWQKTITKHSSGKCNRDESSAACSTVKNLTTFFCVSLFSCQNAWIFTSMTLVVGYQFWARDHPYITSAKGLGGWDQKNGIFADVQYFLCWHRVGGSKKVQKMLT